MFDWKRREFITLVGGAAIASVSHPFIARAQGERVRRVGVHMSSPADSSEGRARFTAFVQGLQQLGWSEGRNLRLDVRWGSAADLTRNRKNAAELIALAPDVILATTGTPNKRTLEKMHAAANDAVASQDGLPQQTHHRKTAGRRA